MIRYSQDETHICTDEFGEDSWFSIHSERGKELIAAYKIQETNTIVHAFYGTDGLTIAAQYADDRIVWHSLNTEEGQDLRKLVLPPTSIQTAEGVRRVAGPVTCPRAAPACVKGFMEYMRHTNECIGSFNRAMAKAREHGRMLDTHDMPMLEKPEWVLRATELVS